jgi:hypothetical protein
LIFGYASRRILRKYSPTFDREPSTIAAYLLIDEMDHRPFPVGIQRHGPEPPLSLADAFITPTLGEDPRPEQDKAIF